MRSYRSILFWLFSCFKLKLMRLVRLLSEISLCVVRALVEGRESRICWWTRMNWSWICAGDSADGVGWSSVSGFGWGHIQWMCQEVSNIWIQEFGGKPVICCNKISKHLKFKICISRPAQRARWMTQWWNNCINVLIFAQPWFAWLMSFGS